MEFKKYYNLGTKEHVRLPTSKTTRKAVNPSSNHETINIKNLLSERNPNQRKNITKNKSYTKKKIISITNK